MKKSIYLSYNLNNSTPLYGNGSDLLIESDKKLSHGDSCNTLRLSFSNHSGTHIDLPCHFDKSGKSLSDYPPNFWEFNEIDFIDISKKINDCELITPSLIDKCENPDAEILIIKTGYGKHRGSDRYTITPPGLSSDLSLHLKKRYKKLKCLGIDLISISSFSNRVEGRKAHHAFLNPLKGNPILLIEDMKLDEIAYNNLSKILVAPLLIENADGAPCTIFAYQL